ncbi:hypothetical protein DFR38_108107 [Aquitalea magnusonii]|uniref:Uncharacterized protein n=1 Tax=Aquitalea magnusonii TaxID=332411 RepID=A0A318JKS0_9NEIS|nr:hypothetical protein DFR38_108107 [Aquitalea magnusonii]
MALPVEKIATKEIEEFCQVLRNKLQGDKVFSKEYLRILLGKIRIREAVASCSSKELA